MPGATKAWAVKRTAQMLASDIRDRLRPGPAPSEQWIPLSPARITADWLTRVLCDTGARVTSVSPVGHTVGTTTRQTLRLTYNDAGTDAGLPGRVFVKCTTGLAQRLMLGLGGLIQGEPYFYAHVRPTLPVEAPTIHFGSLAERSWRSILVLEDVVDTRGAAFWQPGDPITRDRIEDLLSTLATWHGRLWESPRLTAWRWLRSPVEQMDVIDALLGLADRTPAGMRRAADVLPEPLRARGRSDLRSALRRSMQSVSQGPMTYLHGDLHVANTYLTDQGKVGVCDWQCGMRGSWAQDYAYIIATALEVPDRRAWEWELLEFYLERLAAAGGGRLSPRRARDAYRRALFYPYFAWLYTIGRSRLQPHFQPKDVSLTLIGRIATAIDDLASFGAVGL